MRLTNEQLKYYADNGFVLVPEHFSAADISTIKAEIPRLLAEDSPRRVVEKSGLIRSVYGSHMTNEVLRRLSRHPKIVEPAMQIIRSKVYVYQFKINAKAAFGGDVWEWHQDYIFWLKEDSLPAARVTNAVIFLDEVNEFNGPMFLIPGSHKEGVIDVAARREAELSRNGNGQKGADPYDRSWLSNLTADLKYSLNRPIVASLVTQYGMVAPKGKQGSVLFFDSNLVHGSANNISPFDRMLILITFNSTSNLPVFNENSRPDFLVSRDTKPIEVLADDVALA